MKLHNLYKRFLRGFSKFKYRSFYLALKQMNEPVNRNFGFYKGTPIDRKLIEEFIQTNTEYLFGNIAEIGEGYLAINHTLNHYNSIDYLGINEGDNIVYCDLTKPLEYNKKYDCLISTQVLNYIYDFKAAFDNQINLVKEGGTVLLTVACIQQISKYDETRWGDYWRFTKNSIEELIIGNQRVRRYELKSVGNYQLGMYFLSGITVEEIDRESFEISDEEYPIIITAVLHV